MDVNTATREDLVALSGIGEEIADAIIQARPFTSIDQLISIPGIGEVTLHRLIAQGNAVLVAAGEQPKWIDKAPSARELAALKVAQQALGAGA